MAALPIRRKQFKTADFAAWLARNGAEVGVPTNQYEVIRYRAYDGGSKAATHIVYAKETGLLTFTGSSQSHYTQFLTGAAIWPSEARGNPPGGWVRPDGSPMRKDAQPTATATAKRRQKLIDRDGGDCWFCGKALGDDITFEHLVSKSDGGFNKLANLALAHERCNRRAGNLPLVKKIELRAEMRTRDRDATLAETNADSAPAEGSQPGPRSGIAQIERSQ